MHEAFPKVMIQLPMYNEEAVCDVIIDNCCKIKWPRDRLIIQVRGDRRQPVQVQVHCQPRLPGLCCVQRGCCGTCMHVATYGTIVVLVSPAHPPSCPCLPAPSGV
jgi:hypothetical protein